MSDDFVSAQRSDGYKSVQESATSALGTCDFSDSPHPERQCFQMMHRNWKPIAASKLEPAAGDGGAARCQNPDCRHGIGYHDGGDSYCRGASCPCKMYVYAQPSHQESALPPRPEWLDGESIQRYVRRLDAYIDSLIYHHAAAPDKIAESLFRQDDNRWNRAIRAFRDALKK